MDTQPSKDNRDWLDRKLELIPKAIQVLYSMVQENSKSFILTLSLLANIYLVNKIINTNEIMNEKIITEVRKQVPSQVKVEAESQLEGLADSIKNTTQDVREFIKKQSTNLTKP